MNAMARMVAIKSTISTKSAPVGGREEFILFS